MKITILGANGKTGIYLVEQALDAGHMVNALIHKHNILPYHPNLTIIDGDATNRQDIIKVSKKTDVIISTLGTSTAKSTIMTDSILSVIEASDITGVKRFIIMSSYAVGGANQLSFGTKILAKIILKNIVVDKTESEKILKKSNLEWTIVDPVILTDGSKGSGVRVLPENEKITVWHTITRADVAAWILNEAEKNEYLKKEIIISR